MTTIERRSITVRLNQGGYEQKLEDLLNKTMTKQREAEMAEAAEESAGPRRTGQKSTAKALAAEALSMAKGYDDMLAEAESTAVYVEVREVSNRQWEILADENPPRDDVPSDKVSALNLKTFPVALMKAAVEGSSIDLDALSRAHFKKLERECWELHNGDDSLPFVSLVWQLNRRRDGESEPQPGSE